MAREFFRKETKGFSPTQEQVDKVAADLIEQVNSGRDPYLAGKLHYLARVPMPESKFELVKSASGVGAKDIIIKDKDVVRVACTLGEGETTVLFVNKTIYKDTIVTKFRKKEEIKNYKELVRTIRGFISVEAKEEEVIDMSLKERDKMMNSYRDKPTEDLHFNAMKPHERHGN